MGKLLCSIRKYWRTMENQKTIGKPWNQIAIVVGVPLPPSAPHVRCRALKKLREDWLNKVRRSVS